jgi:hypothetical protein
MVISFLGLNALFFCVASFCMYRWRLNHVNSCGSASTRTDARVRTHDAPAPRSLPRRTQLPPPSAHLASEAAFVRMELLHLRPPHAAPSPALNLLRSSSNCHDEMEEMEGRGARGEERRG